MSDMNKVHYIFIHLMKKICNQSPKGCLFLKVTLVIYNAGACPYSLLVISFHCIHEITPISMVVEPTVHITKTQEEEFLTTHRPNILKAKQTLVWKDLSFNYTSQLPNELTLFKGSTHFKY